MTDKILEITVEVLGILAMATRGMKQSSEWVRPSPYAYRDSYRLRNFVKRIAGQTDLEGGLKQLDKLTNGEVVTAIAQLLKIAHNIDNNVTRIGVDEKMHVVNNSVKAVDMVQTTADGGQSVLN